MGQIKALWPLLVACCVAYAGWELLRFRVDKNEAGMSDMVDRVSVIERKMDVHGQMLADIRDAVKEIARRRRAE